MTMTDIDEAEPDFSEFQDAQTQGRGAVRALTAVLAVAALVIAVAAGFFWGNRSAPDNAAYVPSVNAVDAGFARDMATHHQQAVTMAGYARDNSTDPAVVTLAFDIETEQSVEMGRMIGWLDTWNISRTSGTEMAWMGHADDVVDGLMPGMATPAQMTKLQSSHGKALDILFLQLMIHHHQGGIAMAQYAEQHAKIGYVRTLAGQMYTSQTNEIQVMEKMLRQLGAAPLPPPVV
jgi:uncharacterized protein (DUF305 family)